MHKSSLRGRLAGFVLKVGVVALVFGGLIYFAARSVDGGVAGILLLALLSWPAFEFAFFLLRSIWRVQARAAVHHKTLSSCVGAILFCGVGGFLLLFGPQALLGVFAGALVTLVNHQVVNRGTGSVTWPQLVGLVHTPATAGAGAPAIQVPLQRTVSALAGLVFLLGGFALCGLGTVRFFESYSSGTDVACTHPCGMIGGLWVQVIPDSRGDVVTRLDSLTVQLQVRFSDDTPGDKVVRVGDFTLAVPPLAFQQVTGRAGCDAWPSQIVRIDQSTGQFGLCFAVKQSDNIDLTQLVLDWRQGGGVVAISLGKPNPDGHLDYGGSPSPLQS